MVRYPSFSTQMIVQGLAGSHAPDSSDGNRSTRMCHVEMAAPMIASGSAYHRTARSRRAAAMARIGTRGYMQIRWYQHSRHGGKWATSEK
jgi:hypothetical protein